MPSGRKSTCPERVKPGLFQPPRCVDEWPSPTARRVCWSVSIPWPRNNRVRIAAVSCAAGNQTKNHLIRDARVSRCVLLFLLERQALKQTSVLVSRRRATRTSPVVVLGLRPLQQPKGKTLTAAWESRPRRRACRSRRRPTGSRGPGASSIHEFSMRPAMAAASFLQRRIAAAAAAKHKLARLR